jgi:hypothetical protein
VHGREQTGEPTTTPRCQGATMPLRARDHGTGAPGRHHRVRTAARACLGDEVGQPASRPEQRRVVRVVVQHLGEARQVAAELLDGPQDAQVRIVAPLLERQVQPREQVDLPALVDGEQEGLLAVEAP